MKNINESTIFSRRSIRSFIKEKKVEQEKIDILLRAAWYPQDLSASIQNILLQAAELGLGSVWIGTYPDEKRIQGLKKHFNMPENITPFAVIAIGYSKDKHKFIDRFDSSKIHYNKY